VTGGLGYIGRNLVSYLLDRGEEVVIFDIASDPGWLGKLRRPVKVVRGHLGQLAEVLEAVQANRVDCIYHLGAMISIPAEANPWAAYDTNANGTYHVLEAARLFRIGPVVFPSGVATYGPAAPSTVNEEAYQSNPSQIYAATKIFGERLGEYYHHRFGVDFRCASLPAICGPGRREGLAAYPSLMVHEPARGRPCRLPVDGSAQIPFIYIKDVIRCLTTLKSIEATKLRRRVYSIRGFSMRAEEMADVVRKHVPHADIRFLSDETVAALVKQMPKHVDDTRAREDWGWQPDYDWDSAVQDFVREIENHPDLYP
jgi:threonine 3-dehydrogenase